jgi:hypothetical protein
MCWIVLVMGAVMVISGAFLLFRFFLGHGRERPEIAGQARTESMILGGLLSSVGLLLVLLGVTGTICNALGIS